MTTRLDDPLSRSWLRRGYQNPTPTWGQSVPDLWAETTLTFSRLQAQLDDYGGFRGDVPVVFWQTIGHAEVVQMGSKPMTEDQISGPILSDIYMIYTKYPVDPADIPQHGDYVRLEDPTGLVLNLRIKDVNAFNGLRDHLEIETVTYS